jgi:cytochrome P450
VEFDLTRLPQGFHDDPYPVYRALREADPVHILPDGSLFLTRHADCVAVYRDPVLYSSDKQAEFAPKFGDGTPLYTHHTTSLVFNNPPLHTRVRRLIMGALTARAVAAMREGVTRLVDGLITAMAAKGAVDLVEDFAAAIPVEVIGNLLDVPRAERTPLRGWSLAILGALEPALTPAQVTAGHAAVTAFHAYLQELVAARRARPGDPAQDVLTRLIQGEGEDTLLEEELLQNCIFILNAGHETTTNLIANALAALDRDPHARALLLAEPGLMKSAIEEFLRFESPNQLGNRRSTAPAELGGIAIPAGTGITIGIGAANRDPAVFGEPERLDPRRWPNRHLAFGFGTHQCAGLAVARMEAEVALGAMLRRFPGFRITSGERSSRARFRGWVSLAAELG